MPGEKRKPDRYAAPQKYFYHLIQQTGKSCTNQRTKQKGPCTDDAVFSKEQIAYRLCFHADQLIGCKLLFRRPSIKRIA